MHLSTHICHPQCFGSQRSVDFHSAYLLLSAKGPQHDMASLPFTASHTKRYSEVQYSILTKVYVRTSTCEDVAESRVLAADMGSILHLRAKANPLYKWRQPYSRHVFVFS